MKAVILAAGKGTRLLPLTNKIPKPLINIGGKPIIEHIFASLPDEVDKVIVVVGHLKDKIISHIGNSFYRKDVEFVDQIYTHHGTYGALLSARQSLENESKFLVLNGDDIHNKDELSAFLRYPRAFGVQLANMPGYHNIVLDKNGYVIDIRPTESPEKLVATGAYVLDNHIFEHPGVKLKDDEYGLPQTILTQKNQYPTMGVITKKWIPINSLEDLEKANNIMK